MDAEPAQLAQQALDLLNAGDAAGAIRLAEPLCATLPDSYAPHYILGEARRRLGDAAGACAPLARAARLSPDDAAVSYRAGLALLGAGRAPEALEFLQAAVRTDPNYVDAVFTLGSTLRGLGRAAEAVPVLEELARRLPANPSVWQNLGAAFYQSGRFAEAEAPFRRSLELDPAQPGFAMNLVSTLLVLGRKPDCARVLLDAVAAGRWEPAMTETLFSLMGELGRAAEGEEVCGRLLEQNPDDAALHYHRALLLRQLGRTDQARAEFEAAIRHDPENPGYAGNFGLALRAFGDMAASEAMFRRALALAPNSPDVSAQLAMLLYDTGRPREAALVIEAMRRQPGAAQLPKLPSRSIVIAVLDYSPGSPYNIKTLLDDLKDFDGEVICVFNGDQVFDDLRHHPRIDKFSYNKFNVGVSRGWNIGINQAEGDTIFILNADLKIQLATLAEMERQLHTLPDALAVGVWGYWQDPATGRRRSKLDKGTFDRPVEVDEIPGHIMAIHAGRLHDAGISFDPRLAPFCHEETDMAYKAKHAGLKFYALPVGGYDHVWGISMNDRPILFFNRPINRLECMVANSLLMERKAEWLYGKKE
jgi:Flp pilus assembly protein TadD